MISRFIHRAAPFLPWRKPSRSRPQSIPSATRGFARIDCGSSDFRYSGSAAGNTRRYNQGEQGC
jgi:hypothetical protein